jgi:PAS domain S-box-containing protein
MSQRPPVLSSPIPELSYEPRVRFVSTRVALYYLIFGTIWIFGSDRALDQLPMELRRRVEVGKGAAYVVVTTLLLFLLVRRFVRSIHTAEQEMHARLQRVAGQYQQLFERNPTAMIIFDIESRRILAANDAALVAFGYSRDKVLGLTTLDLLVEEERARALARTPELRENAIVRIEPVQCRRRDGSIVFVEVITHLVQFEDKPARIALLADVTEHLRAERLLDQHRTQLELRVAERTAELSQANQRLQDEIQQRRRIEEDLRAATVAAEAANSAKSTFLANTSHEIRTPLTSILGYTDLLGDPGLSAAQRREYLGVVSRNAQNLLALIDDLLDLSRAEIGKVRITWGTQSPREVAHQAVELLRPRASERGLQLNLVVAPDVPDEMLTDGMRLRQILLNLLSNAVKFTFQGSVGLVLHMVAGRTSRSDLLAFDITDTGVGIEPRELQRIFEPFYRIEKSAGRRSGGVGLGLAISRQLAIQMGGHVSVHSSPGVGSTFSLVLPVRPGETPAVDSLASRPVALSGRILLAEDTPNIRLLVDEYLTRAGARVTTVADGTAAVECFRLQTPADPFNLILLDLHMPGLDGAEAMRQIRALGFAGPIVGLTADYTDRASDAWLADGWTAMAAKPIDRQVFIPLLARLMTPPEPTLCAMPGGA